MAVKVMIKRSIPRTKIRDMIPLFREIRTLAMNADGYISGETTRNLNNPDEFIVISNWQSAEHWTSWFTSNERQKIQARIDQVLGGQTTYEVYDYGF